MECENEDWGSDDGLCGPTCRKLEKLCSDVGYGECPVDFSICVIINVITVKRWIEMLEEMFERDTECEELTNALLILNELKEELRSAEVPFDERFDEFGRER